MAKRNWCFTLNNPDDTLVEDDPHTWSAQYVVWQKEKGKDGTLHLQGYCELEKLSRLSAMKKINPRAHWEPRKGNQEQAINYCKKKDETYVEGPWEIGEKKEQGKRTDLDEACDVAKEEGLDAVIETHPSTYTKYHGGLEKIANYHHLKNVLAKRKAEFTGRELHPWQLKLKKKLEAEPHDRQIFWYHESVGNVGKTWMAKYLQATERATVLDCSKKADLAYLLRHHRGNTIIFNIVRTNEPEFMNHIYTLCEQIKDDLVVSTKYEPMPVPLGPQHVLVFSNQPPDLTKWSDDRYDIVEIDDTTPWNPPPKKRRTEPLCPNGCKDEDPCFCAQKR